MPTTGNISFKLDRLESSKYNEMLYRIECQQPFKCCGEEILIGNRGGLVSHEWNIDSDSWVEEGAMVLGDTKIKGCYIKRGCYIKNNVKVNGHKRFSLGGDEGSVTIGGEIELDMETDINMGPIRVFGKGTLTGKKDIIYIGGIISPWYDNGLTAWKTDDDINIHIAGDNGKLNDLYNLLSINYSAGYQTTTKDIMTLSKTLTTTLKTLLK